jgi:hypothetical protein
MLRVEHFPYSPHHRQANRRLRGFHQTGKERVNHEGRGNIAPADVYYGRYNGILRQREEQKRVTLEDRFCLCSSRLKEATTDALRLKSELPNAPSYFRRCWGAKIARGRQLTAAVNRVGGAGAASRVVAFPTKLVML